MRRSAYIALTLLALRLMLRRRNPSELLPRLRNAGL